MRRIILLLLVLASFRFSYGEELSAEMKLLAKEQVESRFLDGNVPIRYYSNILIQLQGNPTKEDSLIFNELVDTLNVLIAKWDVYLIPKGTSNLEVQINMKNYGNWKNVYHQNTIPGEIKSNNVYLDLPSELDFNVRKKIIYYNILRSLVAFNSEQKDAVSVPGSVFTEAKAENITFHPADFEIIKELYSEKYEDKPGTRSRLKPFPYKPFTILLNFIVLFLSFSLLIYLSIKGKFNEHNYHFKPFMRQGMYVVLASAIYLMGGKSISVSPLNQNIITYIGIIVGFFALSFLIICLIFIFERAILNKTSNFLLQILVPFFSLALIVLFASIAFATIRPDKLPTGIYSFLISSLIYFTLLIGFIRSIYIFTRITSKNIIHKKDLELARMSELHKQAELQSLRAKINPHFLYNALNSIASLASTDACKTEQMALALSDFFKYAINREQKQLNTLSEELNAIRTYLEIEKVRFGDRLSFEIDCPSELLDIQIPQLLIQPLVENAIKHGLSQITENGLIRISVSQIENQLKIRVCDNGPAFPDGPLSGFGIQNTQERIALLYGAKATINWRNSDEKYIELCLPLVP